MSTNLRQQILDALFLPTDRDKQRRIGPSDLSNTCARCLADAMLGTGGGDEGPAPYELTTTIGTAVHALLEERVQSLYRSMHTEAKVYVGEVEGYGPIRGTSALYAPTTGTVVAYKTTTRAKIKQYKNGYTFGADDRVVFYNDTLYKHYRQAHLYAEAFEHVETVAIFYIPRDGHNRSDTLWLEFPYDQMLAVNIKEMAAGVLEYARPHGPEAIESNPECFTCTTRGPQT